MSQRLRFNCKSKDVDVIIREIVVQTRNFVKLIYHKIKYCQTVYIYMKRVDDFLIFIIKYCY